MKKFLREISRLKIQLRGVIYLPLSYQYRTFKRNMKFNKKNIKRNKISILVPSRGRANNIVRLINNLNNTSKIKSRIELVIYVDNDDETLGDYQEKFKIIKNDPKIEIETYLMIGEPKSVSKSWNDLAEKSTGDALLMGNDDCIIETEGWDEILDDEIDKFPDKIYCMWFNDGMKAYMYGDFPIVSRKWYKILGYFTPGCFEFTFNDGWVSDLGRRVGRLHYIKKVKIPHLHADIGKDIKDKTWERHRKKTGEGVFQRDKKKYYDLTHQRVIDAKKLMKFKGTLS